MVFIEMLFWLLIVFVVYTYLGYPLLLVLLSKVYKTKNISNYDSVYEPTVTLFVTAFNEENYVDAKVANSLALDYPESRIEFVWVTDGSDDGTNDLLKRYPFIKVYYQPERNGKINAMNRGMQFVNSDIVIFSDGNTLLSKVTVKEIVSSFRDSKVGCVAGEKRIDLSDKDNAATSGEGFYWKYESWIKHLDAQVGSCVGAAGELFAIRKKLFFDVAEDTILDDFIISLTIAMSNLKIDYSPKAYATEKASVNIKEEMKRKVRIAAGSIQSLIRLKPLLNIFKYGFLSVQYFSHKVMRWVVTPLSLVILLPVNILLAYNNVFYTNVLIMHLIFYSFVLLGWILKDKKIKIGLLFVPYYFFIANLSMWLGFFRYFKGSQSVNWERAKRSV